MNEILGLLDTLEAAFLDAKKIPMTDKVMVDEKMMLQLIDKIRFSVKSNGGAARQAIDVDKTEPVAIGGTQNSGVKVDPDQLIKSAQQEAKKMKEGANDYADYILANLQLMVTKVQKNLVKLEKNIDSGRSVIDNRKNEDTNFPQEETYNERE